MKTFVVSLKRAKNRYAYIRQHVAGRKLDYKIIDAVDGSLLTEKEIEENCNMEQVDKYRWWLSNGAIGCALSHLNAYEEFLATGDKAAFIIEDDVLLPETITDLLLEIENEIKPSEIILLYYASFAPAKFSTIGERKLSNSGLYYPIDPKQTITAAAYVIGRTAALNLKENIRPIEVTADSWEHYYAKGFFESLRVQYPSFISIKNFKSSIDYHEFGSIKHKISTFINDYKIPVLYQLLKHKRKKQLDKMLNHFSLTDEPSPIYQKMLNQ
ncbi:glycosyltransferase family 25 protein [Microscilla marina]|uniref:LPS glycosyltransferase subfamily, putative n=1 Tax=Microscilla marina ATCC 23134 TaxID=313606 RepID=A1ZTP7_MICM2|nr:glycosyltransferase family 25 protein [Microscilla marina]EAY26307.1 LPS glycosyltransferase subfamily, putative [Microscilla marina ATCC 23134]